MNWFHDKRIIVPFDYSDASIAAVKVGLQLAGQPLDVHVVHVLLELPPTDPMAVWDTWNDEKRKNAARTSIEEKLMAHDIQGVKLDVRVGVPGKVVTELAEEIDAGLIVIPSHGYTGVKRFLLGSVAERVVRLAHCPVLVLKEQ